MCCLEEFTAYMRRTAKNPEELRIWVLAHMGSSYSRLLAQGAAKRIRMAGGITLLADSWGHPPQFVPPGQGLITLVSDKDDILREAEAGLCVVAVSSKHVGPIQHARVAHVVPDDKEAGKLAAEAFLRKGYPYVTCWPEAEWAVGSIRALLFRAAATELGLQYVDPQDFGAKVISDRADRMTSQRGFLGQAPKPIGIYLGEDNRARDMILACNDLGLDIPEQVGLIGVNNDEHLCETLSPTLRGMCHFLLKPRQFPVVLYQRLAGLAS